MKNKDAVIRHLKRQLVLARRSGSRQNDGPKTSPLAPKGGFPDIPEVLGVTFSAVAAEVRYRGRPDVMLASLVKGTSIAGVFTRSATRAAPVLDCQEKLSSDSDRTAGAAIIVNAGNANAFTGDNGRNSVTRICSAVAMELGLPETRVFSASTGVIGEVLPDSRITDRIAELAEGLAADRIAEAAGAIRTTDTFSKGAFASAEVGGKKVTVAGIAKGSGMIAPDMATMLVYIFTDASVDQAFLQSCLNDLNNRTFNAITVDSDTSTSDTLMVAATGKAGNSTITSRDTAGAHAFEAALGRVMKDLAHQVVRDGEGATKFVEITVTGAIDTTDAKRAALAIGNSPLVKTAIAGEDPNWGRIVMAVGKSGARADRDRISIRFGDVLVAETGWVAPGYNEEDGARYMRRQEIVISVDLGMGDASFTAWTCDLTHGYIQINADYRS
ncbi:MAG: bifunctional glutamate N-acetyltransferase/amino-acid acetyltransferase ArgJ [Pseudomonadota bacterium]